MSEARDKGSTEFAERMLRTMNEAALALMVSVGHLDGDIVNTYMIASKD